jgi:hypothetical protein
MSRVFLIWLRASCFHVNLPIIKPLPRIRQSRLNESWRLISPVPSHSRLPLPPPPARAPSLLRPETRGPPPLAVLSLSSHSLCMLTPSPTFPRPTSTPTTILSPHTTTCTIPIHTPPMERPVIAGIPRDLLVEITPQGRAAVIPRLEG